MTRQWVAIRSFSFSHEAHMAKSLLESCTIETTFRNELAAQVHAHAQIANGIELMVRPKDVIKAIDILKKGGYAFDESDEKDKQLETFKVHSIEEMEKCPYCGSDNVLKFKKTNLFAIVSSLFKSSTKNYQCFECDKKWLFEKVYKGL